MNVSLTLRNWLIGWHICEYEQRGSDRAQYGERLLDRLAEALQGKGISRVDARELRRYRRFYTVYPQIRESLSPELRPLLPEDDRQMGNVSKEALTEEGLEDALLDKLQEFLLELGYGFCFEARQQSIVIGDTRGFVDLVFYHRVLEEAGEDCSAERESPAQEMVLAQNLQVVRRPQESRDPDGCVF